MRCVYHPDREASDNCQMCGKALCEECLGQTSGKEILCSQCVALSAAQDVADGEEERRIEHAKKAEAARKDKKKPHFTMTVIAILAVIVMLANVYMYMGPSVPKIPQFDPYEYPLITSVLINEGIGAYAKEHSGEYPASLKVLLGKYVPYEQITLAVLEMFSYKRFTPTSYELRFKDEKNMDFLGIVYGTETQ